MRKILLGLAATAAIAAPLTAATAASAETVTTVTNATFTVNQPKGVVGQFDDVWKHVYTVTVLSDGNFTGNGQITDNDNPAVAWTEKITGQFTDSDDAGSAFDLVTFNTVPNAGATFSVTDAPMDNSTVIAQSTWTDNIIEFRIAQPVFQTGTDSTGSTCTSSPAVPATSHTEYQWAALVAKGGLHWEYKWTASTKNPSADLFHIWVKSLDLTKKGWPQVSKSVSNNDAKAAVFCDADGSVTWKYGDVTGTLTVHAHADGGTFDYTDSTGQKIHGDVAPGTLVKDGTKTTFTGVVTDSNVAFNHGKSFTVVIDGGTRVGVFVDRAVDNVLADVISGSLTF